MNGLNPLNRINCIFALIQTKKSWIHWIVIKWIMCDVWQNPINTLPQTSPTCEHIMTTLTSFPIFFLPLFFIPVNVTMAFIWLCMALCRAKRKENNKNIEYMYIYAKRTTKTITVVHNYKRSEVKSTRKKNARKKWWENDTFNVEKDVNDIAKCLSPRQME